MEKMNVVYTICLNEKNINTLIEIIRADIKLKDSSVSKCEIMIRNIMKKNISKLSRAPRNREELKEIVRYLNKLCVGNIIEIISKKYPDLHINKKKQITKEQMKRDLDVWGDRSNYIQERPYIKTRKEFIDDDDDRNERDSIGPAGCGGGSEYASAFGDHLITNIPLGQKQNMFNNPHSNKEDTSVFEKRIQQMKNERGYGLSQQQKPPTPDFTLDGSGEKVRAEKMRNRMNEMNNMNNMGGMGNMNNMGNMGNMNYMNSMGSMDTMGMVGNTNSMNGNLPDDIFDGLLGGAPCNNNMQNLQHMQHMQNIPNVPFMGMGNPLMPASSTNIYADQMSMYGMGMNGQTEKSSQLQNDLEKKLAERKIIDVETNQPENKNDNNYEGNMYGCINNMPMNGMPMNGMPMNGMPMNNMPMNGMPMNNMPINNMPMNGMPMNGMPINGMPMNNMPMNGMQNMFNI
ncbi:hypothetical protein QLL95_gp0905 [Cotonvirus japonicus]|uniref:Uncharacterized protein n=1 Tax=Cotonvirus japonicus TaxID=2811091 RepID=A0ABM7NSS3_9VIRU|nr:hypothetical protein QLL95_gp0905 [Cotonvirus japonicus]BCS83218.1 hypothetical protein [Cotonvirus japonicus]